MNKNVSNAEEPHVRISESSANCMKRKRHVKINESLKPRERGSHNFTAAWTNHLSKYQVRMWLVVVNVRFMCF